MLHHFYEVVLCAKNMWVFLCDRRGVSLLCTTSGTCAYIHLSSLTVGGHAQQGLPYLVRVSVCVPNL